ncbi:MAG: sigma-70 family RNA polymerase sigma factor, partial [Actinomycetota bacterium]
MIGQVPEAEFAQAQRLVEIMAAHWYAQNAPRCPPGWDGDDARAAALHGLVTAAQRFDPAKGFRFNTYASSMALGYVRKQLRDYAPVAKDLKRTGEWGSGAFPLEFDRPTGDEDSVSFGELLADDAPGPEALLLADFPAGLEVDQEALWQAVDALKPPQGQVIRWRFQEGKTLQEIAERLKCSRQGVWGLLERALRKLKHCLKADQKTRKAGGRNKTMTMTMERTNSTSNGTLPAWTKRAGAMFARWREA